MKTLDEAQLNAVATYALMTGLDNSKEIVDHVTKCDCDRCRAALVILHLVGDRITAISEAENATKS
jgi:hypothetical protein